MTERAIRERHAHIGKLADQARGLAEAVKKLDLASKYAHQCATSVEHQLRGEQRDLAERLGRVLLGMEKP